MYFAFKTHPGGGAFALFFHPHPREFATQNKKSANARGLARGGGWAQLELTDVLQHFEEFVKPGKKLVIDDKIKVLLHLKVLQSSTS